MGTTSKSHSGTKAPHAECRVNSVFKHSLDFVQEPHAIRHTVKGERASCVVQVDANTGWNCPWNVGALVAVYEGQLWVGAVQTPGVFVPAQTAFVAVPFTLDPLVGDGNVYFSSLPVHLPVTASPAHTVPAQHLQKGKPKETFHTQNVVSASSQQLVTREFRRQKSFCQRTFQLYSDSFFSPATGQNWANQYILTCCQWLNRSGFSG